MGHAQRIQVAAVFEFAVILLGLVWATAGTEIIAFANDQQDGPFSSVIGQIDTLMPLLIGLLLLGPMVWLLVAPFQRERKRQVRRRP